MISRLLLVFVVVTTMSFSAMADSTLGCKKFKRAPDWVNIFTPLKLSNVSSDPFSQSSGTYYLADIYFFENGTYAMEYTEEAGSCNNYSCTGTPIFEILLEGSYKKLGTNLVLSDLGTMTPTFAHGHDAYLLSFIRDIHDAGLTKTQALEEMVISGQCPK